MTYVRPQVPDVDRAALEDLLNRKRPLTDQVMRHMLTTIRPVVRRDGELRYIEIPEDLKGVAFTWSPKITESADGLTEVGRVHTLHTWAYYGCFKPSLEEVLTMIPPDMLDTAKAFETVGPEDASDLNRQPAAMDEGYHVAVTILYG
ncbi:MAG: hypothetical protein ACM3MA_01920 [Acidobacteriota bacterium]